MPATYVVVKSEAENLEDKIVKSGHEQIISPSGVRQSVVNMDKNFKAVESQIALEQAKMENVEHFHEIVKSLTDEQLCAIALYAQAKSVRDEYTKKRDEMTREYGEFRAEIAEIEAQTGLDLHTPVEPPAVISAPPVEEPKVDEAKVEETKAE